MLKNLSTSPNFENLKLDPNTFKHVLSENIVFVTKAFQNRLVIPAFEVFCDNLTQIYEKLKLNQTGHVDPVLKKLINIDDNAFGISVCTVDGQRFSIGDAAVPFCLLALSRPITYGITLNELNDEVHKYQGREPSGRKFNEIVLDHNSKYFCSPISTITHLYQGVVISDLPLEIAFSQGSNIYRQLLQKSTFIPFKLH